MINYGYIFYHYASNFDQDNRFEVRNERSGHRNSTKVLLVLGQERHQEIKILPCSNKKSGSQASM